MGGAIAGRYGRASRMPMAGTSFGNGFAGGGPVYSPNAGVGYSDSFIPRPSHAAPMGYPQPMGYGQSMGYGQQMGGQVVQGAMPQGVVQQGMVQQGVAGPVQGGIVESGPPPGHNVAGDPVVSTGPVYATQDITVNQPMYQSAPVYQSAPMYSGNPYATAMQSSWATRPVVGGYYNYGRPARGGFNNGGCPTWFGSIYGLIMTRDGEENIYFAQSEPEPQRLYLSSTDVSTDFGAGIEGRFGRTFNCCRWGLEFVYWGLFPDDEEAQVLAADVPGNMRSLRDYSYIYADYSFGPGTLDGIADAATLIRLRHREEYHNFEINFLSGQLNAASAGSLGGRGYHRRGYRNFGGAGYVGGGGYRGGGCGGGGSYGGGGGSYGGGACGGDCGGGYAGDPCGGCVVDPCAGGTGGSGMYATSAFAAAQRPRLNIGWMFGLRYFRFNESLFADFDNLDDTISYVQPDNEFTHDVEVENNLIGPQLGLNLDYYLTRCFHLDVGSRFGLYANHVSGYQRIFNGNGPAYVQTLAGDVDFTFQSQEDQLAYLGELRAGIGYKIGRNARLAFGYRAISASGVAIAADQFRDFRETQVPNKVRDIDTDGSLLLHGAYAGLDFAW